MTGGTSLQAALPNVAPSCQMTRLLSACFAGSLAHAPLLLLVCLQMPSAACCLAADIACSLLTRTWGHLAVGSPGKFTYCLPQAALEFILQSGRQPDILHCHDWSTATVARSAVAAPVHSLALALHLRWDVHISTCVPPGKPPQATGALLCSRLRA